jgi:hypothetical protein
MRVVEGLPFIPTETIKLLIRSAMAKASWDKEVEINHFLWQANHAHIVFVMKDVKDGVKFYMELRRKLTEYIKRLLGRKRLLMWEVRPSVMILKTPEAVSERLAYIYGNPAKDRLTDSITEYPNYTSYNFFVAAQTKGADYEVQESCMYIPFDAVEPVGEGAAPNLLGERYARMLRKRSKQRIKLKIYPNSWMNCFKDCEEFSAEVKNVYPEVVEKLKQIEKLHKETGHKCMGTARLREERFHAPHIPKNKERRIFIICPDKELRIKYINAVKSIDAYCKELYIRACKGENCAWPPGTFKPPIPPLANSLGIEL